MQRPLRPGRDRAVASESCAAGEEAGREGALSLRKPGGRRADGRTHARRTCGWCARVIEFLSLSLSIPASHLRVLRMRSRSWNTEWLRELCAEKGGRRGEGIVTFSKETDKQGRQKLEVEVGLLTSS